MSNKPLLLIKQIQKNKAKKNFSRRKDHKIRLTRWKTGLVLEYSMKGKHKNYIKRYYTHVCVPKEFSLLKNPIETLKWVVRLKEYCRWGKNIHINLKGITNLTNDAVALLLSVMTEFSNRGIKVVGNYPKNKEIKIKLEQSGFFSHVFGHVQESSKNTKNTIFAEYRKDVSSELSGSIIEAASNTVFGDNRANEGLQRVLIECMTNTFDHANLKIEGKENWWLSVEHDEIQKKVSFAFIDNGSGILKSIVRTSDYKGVALSVQHFLLGGNCNLLKQILEGGLKKGFKSRTGKSNRGKGLPSIYDALKRNSFSKLEIITNNVHAKLETNEYNELEVPFSGTFVYLEYDNSNEDN